MAGSLEVIDEYDLLLTESPTSPNDEQMHAVVDIFLACGSLYHVSDHDSPSDIFSDSAFQQPLPTTRDNLPNTSPKSAFSAPFVTSRKSRKPSACKSLLFGTISSDSESDEDLAFPMDETTSLLFKETSLFKPISALSGEEAATHLFRPISPSQPKNNEDHVILKPTPVRITSKPAFQAQIDSFFNVRKKEAPVRQKGPKEDQKKQVIPKPKLTVKYRPPSRLTYGRFKFSKEQTEKLKQAFLENPFCPAGRKDKLGAELNIEPEAVRVWLRNARRRMQYHDQKESESKD